jgi:transcription factor C subunit 6
MLERFLPVVSPFTSEIVRSHNLSQQTQDKPTSTAAKARVKGSETEKTTSGAWPWQIGIHRVVWNGGNGLGAAGMLASATASGICRVDWLQGRWLKGRIPYGSVPKIRGELNTDGMDVDDSSSEG